MDIVLTFSYVHSTLNLLYMITSKRSALVDTYHAHPLLLWIQFTTVANCYSIVDIVPTPMYSTVDIIVFKFVKTLFVRFRTPFWVLYFMYNIWQDAAMPGFEPELLRLQPGVSTFSSAPCHFTFTVTFTFKVFHRYLVSLLATGATVSSTFTLHNLHHHLHP